MIVSIVAGYGNDKYEELLPGTHHLTIMPNTPAKVLEGTTLFEKDNTLTAEELNYVQTMFESIGEVYLIENYQMVAGGALSGCGPAFVYMFIEALADGAVLNGLPRDLAYKLASQTVLGSAKMVKETQLHPGILKDQVCSPGGITIQGVKALEENNFRNAVMEAIEVSHLTFSYDGKNDILKDVSFSIPKGSYTTIIGHNGSGKSTMAKLIIGLLEAKKGKIQILGQELNEESVYELRSHIGIVFQNPDNQFIGSTVADDIAFGLENHCVEQEKMQGIIEDVAGRVGMTDFLSAEPTKLSGGQKQRVAIAGILAIEPDIIIFDESTSMLDPQGKASINAQIRKLHEEKNITILSITHDMEEVAQSENVIVLENGEIAMQGTPMDIFKQEDKLAKMQLDIPFGLKISKELKKRGIFKENVCRLDEVVEKLCRLK